MHRPVDNPPTPWTRSAGGYEVEWLGEPPSAEVEVFEEEVKSALVRNESPDVPFTWGVNPYRGCQHACASCYARHGRQNQGLGAGTDFDTKIVVKRNVEERLRHELARKKTRGDWIAFSGVTDPYQPLEASYGLTRGCLQACAEFRNPVGVITKRALVRRDVDVLARIVKTAGARVFISIPFADAGTARSVEPWAPTPAMRFEALRVLSDAGIPTGISISPLIPGLNDSDVPELLERAAEAGATHAFTILLRLPAEVRPVFESRIRDRFPLRADRILSAFEEIRGEQTSRSRFGDRMRGAGPRWDAIRGLFDLTCRRLGISTSREDEVEPLTPDAGTAPKQGELFS